MMKVFEQMKILNLVVGNCVLKVGESWGMFVFCMGLCEVIQGVVVGVVVELVISDVRIVYVCIIVK